LIDDDDDDNDVLKLQSLRYIFAAGGMILSSFKFSWWASKDACEA